jgi:DNA-binding LytR/AlgR family response regulator
MRVVIIEDETAAAQNLTVALRKVCPNVEILATIDTIVDSIDFFSTEQQIDLVFMDIHLADGASFRIFDKATIDTPIIFTTAYDQYAIEAFKVNSIDYLLKPINEKELTRAIEKWQRLTSADRKEYTSRVDEAVAQRQQAEAQVFLVHFRDKIIPLHSHDIAFLHTFEERVTAYCHNGDKYQVDFTLEALQGKLPNNNFFRANRQFIISRKAVKDISVWFGSRLTVNLTLETPERIIIPKARVHEFKEWLTQQ